MHDGIERSHIPEPRTTKIRWGMRWVEGGEVTREEARQNLSLNLWRSLSLRSAFSLPQSSAVMSSSSLYLSQESAQQLDEVLMSPAYGFSLTGLMELAGLAVAETCIAAPERPPSSVVVLCGPGNNGGDGLVAARHLKLWGLQVDVVQWRQPMKEPFVGLNQQLSQCNVPLLSSISLKALNEDYDLIVDAIFGFSFHGQPRAPYAAVLGDLSQTSTPILAVDIPSGWSVSGEEMGPYQPTWLLSLSAPKPVAKHFAQQHWCGGRFIPASLAEIFHVTLPPYPPKSSAQTVYMPLPV